MTNFLCGLLQPPSWRLQQWDHGFEIKPGAEMCVCKEVWKHINGPALARKRD